MFNWKNHSALESPNLTCIARDKKVNISGQGRISRKNRVAIYKNNSQNNDFLINLSILSITHSKGDSNHPQKWSSIPSLIPHLTVLLTTIGNTNI